MKERLLSIVINIVGSAVLVGIWFGISLLVAKYGFHDSYMATGGEPSCESTGAALIISMVFTAYVLLPITGVLDIFKQQIN